jgi:hypothetical protein
MPIPFSVIGMMKTHPQKDGLTPRRFSGIIHLGATLRKRLDRFHASLPQGEHSQHLKSTTPGEHAIRFAIVEAERARAQATAQLRRYTFAT